MNQGEKEPVVRYPVYTSDRKSKGPVLIHFLPGQRSEGSPRQKSSPQKHCGHVQPGHKSTGEQ